MLPKLSREDYYDEDYPLNEQEFKELNFARFDPYWKIRAACSYLNTNCFGDKEALLRRIEYLLFENFLYKRPESSIAKDLASTDIEILAKNITYKSKKFENIDLKELEGYANISDNSLKEQSKREIKHQWPWDVVPELAKKQQNLTYSEIYKAITHFMRFPMVFYNHLQDAEPFITAIVALPYTPKILDNFTPIQLFLIARSLDMQFRHDTPHIVEVIKQKLLDIFYCVEDSKQMHGIVPCQSTFKSCENLASTFCNNFMCKGCCQDSQHREPCIIHDSYEQFFRNKIRSMYLFEQRRDFDITRTLRLFCRKLIRKHDLSKAFQDCTIEWENLAIYYHPTACRIQCVYITFASPNEARRVYETRDVYETRLNKYDVKISVLSTNLYKIAEGIPNAANTLAIIKPFTTLEVVENLPTGAEYLKSLSLLINGMTQLDEKRFDIQEDINPLTGEPEQQHVFVTLPSKKYVDQLYQAQPYFGCLVAHKLSHIQICCYLRYNTEQCLMCSSKKNSSCIHDMCQDCCARQKFGTIVCKCSADLVQSLLADRKQKVQSLPGDRRERTHDAAMKSETICESCQNEKDTHCSNGMCVVCCPVQAIRLKCLFHDESYYSRNLHLANNNILSKKLLQIVAESHIKVRHELKHGRYDWFRPIFGTSVFSDMVKANKDLQLMIDNASITRGSNHRKNAKEGRILTFEANLPVTIQFNSQESIYESVSSKGLPYVEYRYNQSGPNNLEWTDLVKNNPNKSRTYSREDYDNYRNTPNIKIASSFHLLLIGLDTFKHSVQELYLEIHTKLRKQVGQIDFKNIMILENESILTTIYSWGAIFKQCQNLEANLNRLGRVACVKFDNPIDAMSVWVGAVKIALPLNNGTVGEPLVYPSAFLLKLIENFNPSTRHTDLRNLGTFFSKELKELDHYYVQVFSDKTPRSSGKKKNKRGGSKKGRQGKFRSKSKKRGTNFFKKTKKSE